ncbi:MAG: hypothetical protein KDE56_06965, partial [Anaerolineales bacterium]|nr:hypothetical protein [Anaerolineales bacterium]
MLAKRPFLSAFVRVRPRPNENFGEKRPFGEYRGAKPQTNPAVSDRGFTGHKHNDYVGLVYMNARYFVPGIGRFASADTIIPDPMNP